VDMGPLDGWGSGIIPQKRGIETRPVGPQTTIPLFWETTPDPAQLGA